MQKRVYIILIVLWAICVILTIAEMCAGVTTISIGTGLILVINCLVQEISNLIELKEKK